MTILTKISLFLPMPNPVDLIITAVEATVVLFLTFILIERVLIEAYGTEKLAERLKPLNTPLVLMLVLFCLVVALRLYQIFLSG